jgi:DNA-binding CsgD family transcriptional regulator
LDLLEREREIAEVRDAAAAARQGRGDAVAVLGPPGIGKTSLLDRGRQLCEALGFVCLSARGGELERNLAYGVVRQLFERHVRLLPDAACLQVLAGAAALATSILGFEPTGSSADVGIDGALHGLYWLTANLAGRTPLAVFVDDLHWSDAASLRFLSFMARRVAELPVFVFMASRPPLPSTTTPPELAATLADARGITLAPLTPGGIARLVQSSMDDAHPSFIRACYDASGGNPFLCSALLSRAGKHAGGEDDGLELASREVSKLVVDHLGSLPEPAVALARAVAVLGTEAELRRAASLAELDEHEAASAADLLASQEILVVGATVDFVHPLVRTAVRDSIPPAQRALLHARAARLLAADGAEADRIAVQLLAAAPEGDEWAVEMLRTASAVRARGDPATAVTYLRRALMEPPGAGVLPAVLHELGVAEIHAGDAPTAASHLEEARRRSQDPIARIAIARDLSLALSTSGEIERAVSALAAATTEASASDRDLMFLLQADLHQAAEMHPATYRPVRERLRGLDLRPAGDTPGERALLATMATEALLATGRAEDVREWSRRTLDRGLIGDQGRYSMLLGNAAFPLIFADGFEDARRASASAIEDARRRGSAVGTCRAYTIRAVLHLRTGAIRDAEADARTATELGLHAGFQISVMALGFLIEALVLRGMFDEADAELRGAGLDGDIPERYLHNWVLHARGWLRYASGGTAEAIADFEELARRGDTAWLPWNPGIFQHRSGLALALLRLSDRERAYALASEELELARRWGTRSAVGISLRTLGQAGTGDESLSNLRESVAVLESSDARLEQAHSLVELGAALRRAGRRTEARELLHGGMDLAHRCGAEAVVGRAREELVAAGGRPRRIRLTGVDALTPSELRAARMAAEGMTNREIAEALFVTLRTVEVHLTHAYQKLAISSREELTDALGHDVQAKER